MPRVSPGNAPVGLRSNGGTLVNYGPGTVFYGDDPTVTTATFDGQLTAGQMVMIQGALWVVSSAPADVDVTADPTTGMIQTARVNVGAMTASTTIDVAVPWRVAFTDANYTVSAIPVENVSTVATGAVVRQIRTKTATGCTVRISTGTQGFTSGQLFLECIAVHD